MAAIPRRSPLRQARVTRIQMPHYLRLDGGRYLIAAALLLSFLSLMTLGQTGRLATKGYELSELQQRRTELLREQTRLNLRISEAQSITKIEQKARTMQFRPTGPDQMRYLDVIPLPAAGEPAIAEPKPAEPPQAEPLPAEPRSAEPSPGEQKPVEDEPVPASP